MKRQKTKAETPGEVIASRRRLLRRKQERRSLFGRCVLLGGFVWILLGVVFGLQPMNSSDMVPTFHYGDLMLYYRLESAIRATDVVVYEKEGRTLTGRVVAGPGDTVEVTDQSALKINGSQVMESEIYYKTPRYESQVSYPLTLGEEEYFILGDYRDGAWDSRVFGTVRRGEIRGVVLTCLKRVSS